MAYEASQSGLRELITFEGIHNVIGNGSTPNRIGIEFQLNADRLPAEYLLKALLTEIKSPSHPFAAYQGGMVRLEYGNGKYDSYPFHKLMKVEDPEAWAVENAQKYADGAVEFVVCDSKRIHEAKALLVFSSGSREGIFLYLKTGQLENRGVKKFVRPLVPEEQLDNIVRKSLN